MKILIVAHYYPPHIGGIELVAKHQAERLAAHGHVVTVLTSSVSKREHEESGMISLIRIPALNFFEKWGVPFPIFYPRVVIELIRQVKQHDVVHVHDAFYISSFVAALCAWWYRKPVVLTQHVEMVEHPSRIVMLVQKLIYATTGKVVFAVSRAIITLNDRVALFLERHGVIRDKLVSLANGVDTELFHPASREEKRMAREHFGLDPERRIALFVGRFVPKKGFDKLLAAHSDTYQIVFAGGTRPFGVADTSHAVFLGALPHAQLPALYHAADVFVLPSEAEGFPLSVQEAMSSGLPVITTNDPGYARYGFDHDLLCLLDDRNGPSIRDAITGVMNDQEKMSGMAAYSRRYATEHFGWERVISSLINLYEGLLSGPISIQQPRTQRIMIAVPRFYPKIGGVENYAYNLARRLYEQGDYDVSIVTSNPDADANKYICADLDGMRVHYLPVLFTLSNTPMHPLWFFRIKKIIKEERPDIINVHSPVPFMADMATWAAGKTPVVVTYHSGSMIKNQWLLDSIIYVYENIFLNLLFRRVSAIVAVSYNFIHGPWGKKFAEKTMLIRPGVDTSYFSSTPLPDAKVVTYVGRVEHNSSWKGIEQLLQAMVIVVSRHPDARLTIVGSGDAVEHYEKRAQELGIEHAVTMCGAKAGRDLIDAYERSRVVVLPSISEAEQSSVVLIEAMASGRPVIGTRIGGTPYIINEEENGLLVAPRDPEALALAIERILTDNTLAQNLAQGALRSARKVDWQIQVEQYETLFASLIRQESLPTPTYEPEVPRTFTCSRVSILSAIAIWWGVVATLSFNGHNPFGLLNILGFTFLLLVPGFLTLSIVRLSNVEPWARVSMMIAISILELILAALIANTLLPFIGIVHPLSKVALIVTVSLLILTLGILFWRRTTGYPVALGRYALFSNKTDLITACLPVVLIILSVAGALRLNNGTDNSLTVLMLILTGVYVGGLTWLLQHKKLHDSITVPFALWCISLALLLMTSLRGWYTTGHDVQVEFLVFELTKNNGVWLIEAYRDAYNACMSITVLPTIFASLLKLSDPYVYKVLFQIIFAVVPGIIYVFTRKYVASVIALLASFYFIAFPTFFGDMPMLNRQEIAFLFWTLMIYILFEEGVALRLRQLLFVALGVGMILSHYSTTYTVIALLSFLILARPVLRKFMQWPWFIKYGGKSAVTLPDATKKPYVALWMVGVLIAGSFLWSSVLTDTSSSSIYRVVEKTIETIRQNSKEDTRSSDVLYSIFSWGTSDPQKSLELYKEKTADPIRARAPSDTYYDVATYEKYDLHTTLDDQPLTGLGQLIASFGIEVSKTNDLIRQMLAKVLQVLIIIGFLSVVLRRRFFEKTLDTEFFLLAVGNVLMVASQVLLPVLSAEYGVLRAFEQSLMFLGVLVVIGGLSLCVRFSEHKRFLVVTGFAIVFFYAMTGVFTQLFVRHPGQLHLSNAGTYYDTYYTHDSELQAIEWFDKNIPKSPDIKIQTDHTAVNALYGITGAEIIHGMYPGLIRRDSYVLLTYANVHKSQSMVLWNSNIVKYVYPTAFLDEQKDLLYSSENVKIYR